MNIDNSDLSDLIERSSLGTEGARMLRQRAPKDSVESIVAAAQEPAPRNDLDVLVGAAIEGERQAVESVLRRIRPLVMRYCRSRVGGQEKSFASADDVTQEVCLAVLTALPSYRDQGRPFLAFVYGIAAHKVADAHRSSARNRSEPVEEVPDSADQADGPEAQMMQVEVAERTAKLPDKQREIIRLRQHAPKEGVESVVAAAQEPTLGNDLDVLIGAAVHGDRDAVEQVLRLIRPLVVRYCRNRVGNQKETFTAADNIAQEVCLAVLTALPSYRDQGRPFLAFVYDIAAHKVADANRSSSHNRAEPALEAGGPEAQLKQIEVAERTAKLLDMLPDKQREVIRLRIVEGLSAEETAEIVGSTPGAVRVAQHRALSRLRIATAETAAERTAHAVGSTSETVQVAHHRALSRLCSVLESE